MKRTLVLLAACSLLGACSDDSGRNMSSSDSGADDGIGTDGPSDTGADDDGDTSGDGGDGASGGSGDSDTDTEGADDGMNCGEQDFAIDAVPPNVMLVLDKSGSMVKNSWDHDNDGGTADITRWNSLHNVVDFVVNDFNDKINFGAVLFPSEAAEAQYGAAACRVETDPEVPVGALNAQDILDGIPAAMAGDTVIAGATPASKGVTTAVDHLKALDPSVDRFMILVTDGAANCNGSSSNELMEDYDVTLPDKIASALSDDIKTFVVGIDILDEMTGVGVDGNPEANPFLELNKVANEGGSARPGPEKFYNAANEIELQSALQEIAGQVISCVIDLDKAPEQKKLLKIVIDGMEIPFVEDCASENGWTYPNPDGPYDVIELCGSACDQLAEFGALDATLLCPDVG